MKGLCVVLVVLVVVKVENALAAELDELQQPPEEEEIVGDDVAVQSGGGGRSDVNEDAYNRDSEPDFEIDTDGVDDIVCAEFDGFTDEVAKVINKEIEDGNVIAKLDDDDRCNNIKRAVQLLPKMETIIERKTPNNLCYIFYEEDEGLDVEAEHLWEDGFKSGLLRVAVEEEVPLEYGCAKNGSKALCIFEPPGDRLTAFKEEAEQRAEELKNEYSMSRL